MSSVGSSQPEKYENLLTVTIAGMVAGSVEKMALYPMEYWKTRYQLHRNISGLKLAQVNTRDIKNLSVFYTGSSVALLGTLAKSLTRFTVYNKLVHYMAEDSSNSGSTSAGTIRGGQVSTSAPKVIMAGMLTGALESVTIVPFESIKTTMIERSIARTQHSNDSLETKKVNPMDKVHQEKIRDNKPHIRSRANGVSPSSAIKSNPGAIVYRANMTPLPLEENVTRLSETIKNMYSQRGLTAFVQGFWPTLFRQGAYSSVRFSSYHLLKQAAYPARDSDLDSESAYSPSSYGVMFFGGLSSAAAVLITQPIDVIKTRMQTVNAKAMYGSSLICVYRICLEENTVKTLWSGTVPRLGMAFVGGAVVFQVYEMTEKLMNMAAQKSAFAAS
ncbi:mitochondrial carrier [Nadsonia fulvescens var. elongata DSM 6958]|uniref:Mitochondrial carrier n=1 Tax=Nadsonia fulvescens var. elongata DSM 6958 TaxID=857566 RepID=A0A1E3PHN1_9ASCO|nr:mitochondrial carrier [Nadsonia fulvescens var. elongata DSM 6958]